MSLLTDIRELLDESGGSVFWTADHIYDAANEALMEEYAATKHQFTTATLDVGSGVDLISLPTTVMLPQYIIGTAGKYFPTTQAKLEQVNREWRGEPEAYPKFFVLWDVRTVRAWPRPDDAYAFYVAGVPWPSVEINATNTDISEPGLFKRAVAYRAVSALLEHTHPMLADQYIKEAEEQEYQFRVQLRNRGGHNIRRVRPGTLFTKAQSGVIKLGSKFS